MHLQNHLELEFICPHSGSAVLRGFKGVPRHASVGVHLQISWNLSPFVPKTGVRFLKVFKACFGMVAPENYLELELICPHNGSAVLKGFYGNSPRHASVGVHLHIASS